MKISRRFVQAVFGIKVKSYREQMGMSLDDFSIASGISKSYLNEIEHGKKYPRNDKILELARALGKSYDELVSLSFIGEQASLNELFFSGWIDEAPLEAFGIDEEVIIQLLQSDPNKAQMLLRGILNVSLFRQVSYGDFCANAELSFRESRDNYLERIEQIATEFRVHYLQHRGYFSERDLQVLLSDEFGVQVTQIDCTEEEDMRLQWIWVQSTRSLHLHPDLGSFYRVAALLQQLYFLMYGNGLRIDHFPSKKHSSFEQIKSGLFAVYFSLACMMDQDQVSVDINELLTRKNWSTTYFKSITQKYRVSGQQFLWRMAHLLRAKFGIEQFTLTYMHRSRYVKNWKLDYAVKFIEYGHCQLLEEEKEYCRMKYIRELDEKIIHERSQIRRGGHIDARLLRLNAEESEFELFDLLALEQNEAEDKFEAISLRILLSDTSRSKIQCVEDPNLFVMNVARDEMSVNGQNELAGVLSDHEIREQNERLDAYILAQANGNHVPL